MALRGVVVNERLDELLKPVCAEGTSRSGIIRILEKLDPVELVEALQNGGPEAEPGDRFRFIEARELKNLPPQEWLVPGIIPKAALVGFVSPPERFKTFTIIDLILSVANGQKWLGRYETAQGPSILVLAEGSHGLPKRVEAWEDYCGAEAAGHFVIEAVPLMDDVATNAFIREVKQAVPNPALIVFDTLARCMLGGDENSARDMGLVIANADRVRQATGATVILVHHTTKGSVDVERGSGALRGACDTMLRVVGDDREELVLRCEKQKDAEHFDDIPIRFRPHLESGLITARIGVAVNADALTSKQLQVLESLSSAMGPDGLPASKWYAVSEQTERTFFRARKVLHDKGFVFADKVGRGALYTLTDKGEKALAAKLPITANVTAGSDPTYCLPARPPLEGAQQVAGRAVTVNDDDLPYEGEDYEQAEREGIQREMEL